MYGFVLLAVSRTSALCSQTAVKTATIQHQPTPILESISKRNFSLLSTSVGNGLTNTASLTRFVAPTACSQLQATSVNVTPCRTLIKFSHKTGKRKTVHQAVLRFFRLHWGGWIRTRCGRHKKMHQKSQSRKRRLRQHVMCNATQSMLMDKMVNKFWRTPKYYINDPYEPYHTRDFHFARVKPRPYPEQPLTKPMNDLQTAKLWE